MPTNPSPLHNINHIVVIMLENRSFDHMLGYLYADHNNVSPLGHPFEGLTGKETNPDGKGKQVSVYPIQGTDPHPYFQPGANPGEGYLNTNSQLFGKTEEPSPLVPPANQGFIANFAYTLGWEGKKPNQVMPGTQPSQIMGMYTPQLLPVLSGLARGYAVCDLWFSSAPTETFPNRAFLNMATSQGRLADSAGGLYTAPSIFTALANKGATWAIYGYDKQPLNRGSVADIAKAPETNFGEFADFQKTVQQGSLANYVFLEPQWGPAGSSQHPNYDVSLGEQLLHDIYVTLYDSKLWAQTLLIITYDEHGGCYDHVPPPSNAVAPDNSAGQYGFNFQRFGIRVPTVLVSPLIPAGTVFRTTGATPFDHTSILATLEKRFDVAPLTKRDAAAPDVGGVLTLSKARTDDPLSGVRPPSSKSSPKMPKQPDHLETALAQNAADLPLPDPKAKGKGYHHEIPVLKTGKDAHRYVKQRYQHYHDWRKAHPKG